MSETKFTPGPWDKFDLIIGRMIDNRHRYTSIASIYESEPGYDGEDKANANLIAAAPDLYESLMSLLIEYDKLKLAEDEPESMISAHRNAKQALAKARGEV